MAAPDATDPTTGTVASTLTVALYVNGEYRGESAMKATKWSSFQDVFALYKTVYDASQPDKIAYSANKSSGLYFSVYGGGFFYTGATGDARLIRVRNIHASYGKDPRVDYAPIKLLGNGMTALAPDETVVATNTVHASQVTLNPLYSTYDVVSWKNFYTVKDTDQTITLPTGSNEGATFVGWYGDSDYQNKISTLTVPAGDSDGVTAYARAASITLDRFYVLPGSMYTKDAAPTYGWQGSDIIPVYNTSGENDALWIEFDYYIDEDTDDLFSLRFKATDKNPVLMIQNGKLSLTSTFFEADKVTVSGNGWHRIAMKYEQSATVPEGESTPVSTYRVTVFLDGAEVIAADVTKAIETWETANGWNLYTPSVAEDGSITYAANTKLRFYFYGDHENIFGSASGLRYERHLNLVRNLYLTYGDDSFFDTYAIKYNLNGGSLALDETVSGWEAGVNGDHRFGTFRHLPFLADGTAATVTSPSDMTAYYESPYEAMAYRIASAKEYYVAGNAYTLPTPALAGMSFVGWFDNPEFTGEPITEISADQVGNVELYAKYEGNWRVTLNVDDVESTVDGKHNLYTVPDTAELWFVAGALYEAGESVTLTADTTFYALGVELLDGASIRMHVNSGLRFETVVRTSLLDVISDGGASYTIGTLITPTDLLTVDFTAEALGAAGIAYANLTSKDAGVNLLESGSSTAFLASVININAQNYARAFSAISYLEVAAGDRTCRIYSDYSAENNSRSVYEVAKAAYADIDYGYSVAQLSIIKSFIDGVLVLDAATLERVNEVSANGYTSPYTVSYADGVITVTKPAEQALATVIIGERIFTGNWTVSEDGTTVTARYTAVAP